MFFFKVVSYAQQGCIYLIKNNKIVKNYSLIELFSTWIYLKM